MLDYENMVKALRISWLKRIVDPDYFGFWKSYLNHLLVNEAGLFLTQCNYNINRLTISAIFYRELLDLWSKLREVKDPENIHKYVLLFIAALHYSVPILFCPRYFELTMKP